MGNRKRSRQPSGPLLSVEETATLLGESRSTIYRAIKAGTLPLPVYRLSGRMRIPKLAVERLIAGLDPNASEPPAPQAPLGRCEACGGPSPSKRRATCSAARRSSSGTTSV